MTVYLIKAALCSGLLLLIYKLLLEQETFHRLKRFYLLSSLVLSFLIPLVPVTTESAIVPLPEVYTPPIVSGRSIVIAEQTHAAATGFPFTLADGALFIYLLIASLLLFRFVKNLIVLFRNITRNEIVVRGSSKIVLLHEPVIPHSFLNYVFLNRADLENGSIEEEVLLHEKVHVAQKHPYDVLLIELLQALFWINPFLRFYKSAIKLNHEFLADARVIMRYQNIPSYQQLLLSKASFPPVKSICSELNYSTAKKRFLMMTKTTKTPVAICKMLSLVPLLAAIFFLFSSKVMAQETVPEKRKPAKAVANAQEGVSQVLLDEYETILGKYRKSDKTWWQHFGEAVSETDRSRLETIFKQMSKAQQEQQTILFMPPLPPITKVVPSSQQLESWKNEKMYGVWVDGRRVSIDVLNRYTASDFSHFFSSKLEKNAKNYGKHYYQIDLMTNDHYQEYLKNATVYKKSMIVFRRSARDGGSSK